MKDTLKKTKKQKSSKSTYITTFLVFIVTIAYMYVVMIWSPETKVTLLENSTLKYIKIGVSVVLALYVAFQLDRKYFRAPKYSSKQIEDYELWDKFLLHFAFLKTGSSNEKAQVLEVLRYLEDSELKQTLTDVYEQNISLKDAHNEIVEKYPYPQVKTFFSEAEDSLVRGADGNRLMQKTALNIDKYISDITTYTKEKQNSFILTRILLWTVVILTVVAKVGFNQAFNGFADTYTGIIILVGYFILLTRLFIKSKENANSALIHFGGDDNE